MAASAIILVIACLNLANMLIVQGTVAPSRDRRSLGPGRGPLADHPAVARRVLLLALLGGVSGVLLAVCGMRILNAWVATAAEMVLRVLQVGLNVRVLMVTLGFCLIATLLFGLRNLLCGCPSVTLPAR